MLLTGRYPAWWEKSGARAKNTIENRARAPQSDRPPRTLLRFLATCAPGLEAVVAAELQAPAIRAASVSISEAGGGVFFSGTWIVAYNAILWLRCGSRVLHLIASANLPWDDATGIDPVYHFIRNAVLWKRFLVDEHKNIRRFSIECNVRDCSRKSVSLYAPMRASAAINDALNLEFDPERMLQPGHRSVDIALFLLIYKDTARLYRDMSSSLSARGYKGSWEKTSLREEIAAGILTLAGWNSGVPGFGEINRNAPSVLLDPMCGHGTFLIEAALMASNSAPGLLRKRWPFMAWHDFDEETWEECRFQAAAAVMEVPSTLKLLGNDRDRSSISACARAAELAGVEHLIDLSCQDFGQYKPCIRPAMVVVNPPFENKDRPRNLFPTYLELGKFLRRRCCDADAYVLSSDRTLAKQLKLKPDTNWSLTLDGLDFRLCHYIIFPKNTPRGAASHMAPRASATCSNV